MKQPLAKVSFIKKDEINSILNLRDSKEFLKRRLESVEAELKSAEASIIDRLEHGASFQAGVDLSVRESERRYPAWKEHFISYVGKEEADKILEATSPSVYQTLVIKTAKAA